MHIRRVFRVCLALALAPLLFGQREALQRDVGGNGVVGTVSGAPFKVATIAALKASLVARVSNGQQVEVAGYATAGDGGGGVFQYSSASSATANDGTVVAPTVGGGRWLRVFTGPINVRWFGADGTGVTDATSKIQAAINTTQGDGRSVWIPGGTYLVTSGITIASNRTHIFGDGVYATRIQFTPTATAACFSFTNGASMLSQCSIRGLTLSGGGSFQKIGVKLMDVSEMTIKDIVMQTWTGNTSIGIQIKGRELTRVDAVDIYADRPISIEANPNAGGDCDHFHFSNLCLAPQVSTEASILMAASTDTTSFTIDGYNAFVFGKYGIRSIGGANQFYWNLSNIRFEQGTDSSGYFIDATNVSFLTMTNCQGGTATHGYKFRTCSYVTLVTCTYENSSGRTALDVDNTCDQINGVNVLFQTGSVQSLGGMTAVMEIGDSPGIASASSNFYLEKTASPADKFVKIYGVRVWQKQLTIANTTPVDLDAFTGNQKASIVEVSAYSATGPVNEGGIVSVTAAGAVLISGTSNFGVGNTPNKLTVFWQSASSVSILNNLSGTPSIRVMVSVRQATD